NERFVTVVLCIRQRDRMIQDSGVNLTIAQGTIAAILGPAGAGKTFLLEQIAGFASADSGEVRILDVRVPRASADGSSRQRDQVAFVPRHVTLCGSLDLFDNVALGVAEDD